MWEIVESRRAFITSLASIVSRANTATIELIAHLTLSSNVAITQRAHSLAEISICALIASHSRISGSADALTCLFVAVVVESSLTITIAR